MVRLWIVNAGLGLFILAAAGSVLAADGAGATPAMQASSAPAGPADFITTDYVWQPVSLPAGVTTSSVSSLAVSPIDADTLFLGTWTGLYQSANAGQTWARVATDTLSYVSDVDFAPGNAQRLYVSSWAPYRSDDGGATWAPLAEPPSACGLTVAPSNPDRVYARACNYSETGPALYRSDDAGQTWITPTLAFTQSLDALAVAPGQPDVLIAASFSQVFRSADAGATWATVPIGVRYFGRPVFDPQAPSTLYLGHWQGLLRSPDLGQTWEDSGAGPGFAALIPSPFAGGEVLGEDDSGSWRLLSSGLTWSAQPWATPPALQALWRSAQDGRAIYAQNATGLWRYVRETVIVQNAVFLPLVQQAEPGTFPAIAQQALDRANGYRARVDVIPLRLHASIVASAQNHANYYMLNVNDPSAWTYGAHGEVSGKPGYTGRWPSDRIVAAGFPWFGGSEVMHFIGDPVLSVDGWMATIYHRVILLDPGAHYTGYGNGKNNQTAVDVMDFGGGPTPTGIWSPAQPYPQAYPANGQTDVPTTWGGGESPDPLPPGAPRPVGYPFTLQGVGDVLNVSSAQMRDGSNAVVPVYPNPTDCATFNCYALISVSPLHANTVYTVQATGTAGGVPFNQTWAFTTGPNASAPSGPKVQIPPGPPLKVAEHMSSPGSVR